MCREAAAGSGRCGLGPVFGSFRPSQSTTALSGGLRYRPTTSRTLSTNWGSGDSLKCSVRCGFVSESPPYARNRRLGQPDGLRHGPGRPVRSVSWCLFEGLGQYFLDLGVVDGAGRSRAGLVVEAVDATVGETVPPLGDRHGAAADRRCDVDVGHTVCRAQHDTAPHGEALGGVTPAGPPLEGLRVRLRSGR